MPEIGIISALALALPKLGGAKKDAANPAFKRNGKEPGYATLAAVIDALEPLKEHGLWFLQISHERENGACFETFAIHGPSGAQMSLGTMFVPADRNNAQGFGSAQTYCRRYGLMSAFGIAPEDDDGNAAAAAPPARQSAPRSESAATVDRNTIAQMIGLCEALGGNQAQVICDAYKVSALSELTAKQATGAIKRLNEKLAERAKETTGEVLSDEIPY